MPSNSRAPKSCWQGAARAHADRDPPRRAAGQHEFTMHWLKNFPHEKVAGEILQKVKQTLDGYQSEINRYQHIVEKIDEYLAQVQDTKLREKIRPICDGNQGRIELQHARSHGRL